VKRYPSLKIAAKTHSFYIKNSVKNRKNENTRKIANISRTVGNIAKSSKFQRRALFLGTPQGMIIGLKL